MSGGCRQLQCTQRIEYASVAGEKQIMRARRKRKSSDQARRREEERGHRHAHDETTPLLLTFSSFLLTFSDPGALVVLPRCKPQPPPPPPWSLDLLAPLESRTTPPKRAKREGKNSRACLDEAAISSLFASSSSSSLDAEGVAGRPRQAGKREGSTVDDAIG